MFSARGPEPHDEGGPDLLFLPKNSVRKTDAAYEDENVSRGAGLQTVARERDDSGGQR